MRQAIPHRVRAWWRSWRLALLFFLLTGAVAVVVGVPTASVDGSLGPHRATYAVAVNHLIEVDLGPLGALVLDSPLPRPLGVEVRVQEIPAALTVTAATGPESAIADDLGGYLQFFTQPDLALREAARGLVRDALARVVLAWSVLLVLVAAARLAVVRGGLQLDLARMGARSAVWALLAVGLAAAGTIAVRDAASAPRLDGRTSSVLAGTPLEDARIVGRLRDIVDTYGGYAVSAIERNRVFYDAAAANLVAAYEADVEPPPGPEPGDTATAEPGSGEEEGAVFEPGRPAPRDPAEARDAAGDELVTFLVVADLHCNVGMARVVGEAVRLAEVDAVLNAGDTVISGTSVEQFCVTALAEAVPDDVPVVVSDGNHDSTLTSEQERRAGHVVLAGDPVVVAGVRVLGDAEPVVTTVAEGVRLRAGESRDAMGLRLAERACESAEVEEPVDILLVHNPRAGVTPMASGCVVVQVSGHFHRTLGPTPQGLGLLYVAGSTAGATAGKTSIGPLQSPGVMTVMRYDPGERRPVDYRIITIGTDAAVDLGPWQLFPGPPVMPTAAELDLPDPLPVAPTGEP